MNIILNQDHTGRPLRLHLQFLDTAFCHFKVLLQKVCHPRVTHIEQCVFVTKPG